MHRCFALALAALFALPAAAQVDGIGYRLSPSGTYVLPESDAALSNGFEVGGAVGFSFGEFVELGGQYLYGLGFETDYDGLSDLGNGALAGLTPRDVTTHRYGGDLKLNILRTGLAPYLSGGAGVIRFEPDGLDASRNIYLSAGGGIQLTGADRFALSVGGTVLSYRYNPARTFLTAADLASAGLTFEDVGQRTVLSPLVRASVQVYLGGRRPGELSDVDRAYLSQFRGGLTGLSLQLAPTVGYVDFNDRFAYREVGLVGGEAGFDFGPLVGVRGFYLRGVDEDDPTDIQDIQMYGALGRFRLSDGSGLVPVLTLGGGYLDVLDGYTPRDGFADAEDRPFAMGGVGLEIPAFRRLRVTGEVRALAMSTADRDDVSSPEEVYLSPVYRAGVSFALGGSAGRQIDVVRRDEADAELARQQAEMDSTAAADLARQRDALAAQRDSALTAARMEFEAELAAFRQESAMQERRLRDQLADAEARGDSVQIAALRADVDRAQARAARLNDLTPTDSLGRPLMIEEEIEIVREGSPYDSGRTITLPVPRMGELYVRYGDPTGTRLLVDEGAAGSAGLSDEAIRARAREAIRVALVQDAILADTTLTDDERAARIEAALNAALDRETGPAGGTAATLTDAQLREVERRVETRMLDEIRALRRDLGLPPRAATPQEVTAPTTTSPTRPRGENE